MMGKLNLQLKTVVKIKPAINSNILCKTYKTNILECHMTSIIYIHWNCFPSECFLFHNTSKHNAKGTLLESMQIRCLSATVTKRFEFITYPNNDYKVLIYLHRLNLMWIIGNRLGWHMTQKWKTTTKKGRRRSADSYLRLDSVSLGGLAVRGTHMQNRKVQIKHNHSNSTSTERENTLE